MGSEDIDYSVRYTYDQWFEKMSFTIKSWRWHAVDKFIREWCIPLGLKEAPAACYHHGSFQGGLVDHMCRVMEVALNMRPVTFPELYPESVAIAAGLHDLSKLGSIPPMVTSCPSKIIASFSSSLANIERSALPF